MFITVAPNGFLEALSALLMVAILVFCFCVNLNKKEH